MGIIVPKDSEVQHLKGLHLYHHGMSQCSQRVRICLEEKQLPWVDHTINLMKGEHLEEAYGRINPNNVVPTLVHDGVVVIESTDIIQYIDEHFPGPSFTPDDPVQKERMIIWLEQSNALKPAIRILSHEFLFKPVAKKSAKELTQMVKTVSNVDLIEFHSKFSSKRGLDIDTVRKSICEFEAVFKKMDLVLSEHRWLAGDSFSLADISWMADVHRLLLMNFSVQRYPHLREWVERLKLRPSYQRGLIAYEPILIKYFFRLYFRFLSLRGNNLAQVAVPC